MRYCPDNYNLAVSGTHPCRHEVSEVSGQDAYTQEESDPVTYRHELLSSDTYNHELYGPDSYTQDGTHSDTYRRELFSPDS